MGLRRCFGDSLCKQKVGVQYDDDCHYVVYDTDHFHFGVYFDACGLCFLMIIFILMCMPTLFGTIILTDTTCT